MLDTSHSHLIFTQPNGCCCPHSSKEKGKVICSRMQLLFSPTVISNFFATTQTVTHQGTMSMVFPRQEYWSGLPFPSPGDLPEPGIEPASPALAGRFFTTEPPGNLKNINEENSKTQMKKTSNPSSTPGPKINLYQLIPSTVFFLIIQIYYDLHKNLFIHPINTYRISTKQQAPCIDKGWIHKNENIYNPCSVRTYLAMKEITSNNNYSRNFLNQVPLKIK